MGSIDEVDVVESRVDDYFVVSIREVRRQPVDILK